MVFGSDHFTRDWDLLACVCAEWTKIRALFGLGPRAPQEQIETVWDEIFNADRDAWPCIRRVFYEMMRDPALALHLSRCYWKELQPWQRRGYTFAEILPVVLSRLCWTVVRNAGAWAASRKKDDEHWARFWNTLNLTRELRRAIEDMWENEGPRDRPLPNHL
jgi:hypothetical protein